ncbi:hypothetical protein P886_2470 [Alteromonadaceae bacterium 2753L.S.0a.02]|nr:hypothetical protein P886_2470 [Alteromonadaceae bacterium 2753L.S.0a.02]
MNKMMCYTLFAILAATAVDTTNANAAPEKVFSLDASGIQLAADSYGERVYIPDQKNNALSIVNANSLLLETTLPLNDTPVDIALDEAAGIAYISLQNTPELLILDLVSRELTGSIALPQPAHELVVGNAYIYATPVTSGNDIMRISKAIQAYVDDFSGGVFVYYRGALELTPNKDRLVFANRGLSPGTLAVFDISASEPQLLIKNAHGALGSNGQNISVDPINGDFVSYAVGGGNGSGYTIAKLDITDFTWQGEFDIGAYPRAVHHSLDGFSTYTNNTANQIKVWDNTNFSLQNTFVVSGNPKDFADLRDSTHLAVLGDQEFAIYRVKDEQPAPTVKIEGRITGSELYRVVCTNNTTGQRVKYNTSGQFFDCISAGLSATKGDAVRMTLYSNVE